MWWLNISRRYLQEGGLLCIATWLVFWLVSFWSMSGMPTRGWWPSDVRPWWSRCLPKRKRKLIRKHSSDTGISMSLSDSTMIQRWLSCVQSEVPMPKIYFFLHTRRYWILRLVPGFTTTITKKRSSLLIGGNGLNSPLKTKVRLRGLFTFT